MPTLFESPSRVRGFLVAGGAGFNGSHVRNALLCAGAEPVVVVDDFNDPRINWSKIAAHFENPRINLLLQISATLTGCIVSLVRSQSMRDSPGSRAGVEQPALY